MNAKTSTLAGARRERGDRTRRDELLRIAARVFAQKGIASATVRDIAQEAGILSGSLYHHFTSKEEMVREIIGTGQASSDTYRRIVSEAGSPRQALEDCIRHAVGWVADNPDAARMVLNDAQYIRESPSMAETEKRRQANRIIWVEIVEAGMKAGDFRADVDPDLTVRAMWDAVLSSIRWFPPLGTADPAYVAEHLARLFTSGIEARAQRSSRRPRATGSTP